MDKNVTIYDIAKEAQVSPATVSRVLTGSARVNHVKREKVEKLIEKYNFSPNALARSLIKRETKNIGFILPDIANPFFSSVFVEAEKRAMNMGYTMILCNAMNDNMLNVTNIESLYLKILSEKQVDGIILMGGRINDSKTNELYVNEMNELQKRIPIVMINGRMKGVDCPVVRADEKEGISSLVEYLYGLGHKTIGFLGGMKGISSTDEKLKAFIKAIANYGITCKKEWMIQSFYSIDDGFTGMEKLLENRELPTAVIAVNDFVAIGAVRAAEQHGIRIPADISITGFDGIYLTDLINPRITTVSQNCSSLGAVAMDAMVDLIRGDRVKKETIIKTELVIKDSCKSHI